MKSLNPLEFPFHPPPFRFTAWHNLPSTVQTAAKTLSYNSTTWNYLGTCDIEDVRWTYLTDVQQDSAREIGFGPDTWDCWMNHYEDYTWAELDTKHRQIATDLGYDELTWAADADWPIEALWWRYADDAKDSLKQFCYFEDSWDGIKPLFIDDMGSLEPVDKACADVTYDLALSFLGLHLILIAIPQASSDIQGDIIGTAFECQYPIIIHDNSGLKSALKVTLPVSSPKLRAIESDDEDDELLKIFENKGSLHLDSFAWKKISAAYDKVHGWGDHSINILDATHNCWGLGLALFSELGMQVDGNKTITEFMASKIAPLEGDVADVLNEDANVTAVLQSLGVPTPIDNHYLNDRARSIADYLVRNYYLTGYH